MRNTRIRSRAVGTAHGVSAAYVAAALEADFLSTGVVLYKGARATGVNLTVIVQGTNRIYGTLGDSRCTVDTLAQRPLKTRGAYRVEARGFCTQPAHAVRGNDAVLVSTNQISPDASAM